MKTKTKAKLIGLAALVSTLFNPAKSYSAELAPGERMCGSIEASVGDKNAECKITNYSAPIISEIEEMIDEKYSSAKTETQAETITDIFNSFKDLAESQQDYAKKLITTYHMMDEGFDGKKMSGEKDGIITGKEANAFYKYLMSKSYSGGK